MEDSERAGSTQQAQLESPEEIGGEVELVKSDLETRFYKSPDFALTAATISFDGVQDPRVLIVHHLRPKYGKSFYALPGGRTHLGECLKRAAWRRTREETGYNVRMPPISVPTRATRPDGVEKGFDFRYARSDKACVGLAPVHASSQAIPVPMTDVINNCSQEPLAMITYRDHTVRGNCIKVRFYFYAMLLDRDAHPKPAGENMQAQWVTVPRALDMLRFEAEKDAVRLAHEVHSRSGLGTGVCDPFYRWLRDFLEYVERTEEAAEPSGS